MTEAALTAAVLEAAGLYGWQAIHQRPAVARSGRWATAIQGPGCKGWPDVFAVRSGRAVAAELKVGRNRPSPEQRRWMELLDGVPGIEVYVWTDLDWGTGAIEAVLR